MTKLTKAVMEFLLLDVLQSGGFCCFSERCNQFQTGIISEKSFDLYHPVHTEKTLMISLSALVIELPLED